MVGGSYVKDMTTNFKKLDKFEGHEFRGWNKNMHFLLTTLRSKLENDDYICKGHILNSFSDTLFDIYHNVESAKELWDSLESKYMEEDASNKLPPSCKDFIHSLKHGKDDMSLVQLGSHLRIEESLRAQESDKGKGKEVVRPSENMMEEGGKNTNNKQNKGKKRGFKDKNGGSGSNKKPKVDVEDGYVLYLGDDHFALVHEKGSVVLEFSSGKSITLVNVLYVLKLRFGYYNNGMFMLNLNKVPDSSSVYMSSSVVNSSLWHARLGHESFMKLRLFAHHIKMGWLKGRIELLNKWVVVRFSDPKIKTLGEKESRDAIFDENHFSSIPRPKDIIPNLDESKRDDHSNEVPSETSVRINVFLT
ncbi:hypothetical protein Tco_0766463 [Tanacetum coccineum]